MNDYVDKFLIEFNAYLIAEGLDSVILPDQGGEVGWSIFVAEMSLKNGWLQGLNTIKRNGDVTVSYQHSLMKLRLPLRIQNIKVTIIFYNRVGTNLYFEFQLNYDYAIQLMNLGPSGVLDGFVEGCKFLLQIEVNMTTMLARLDEYDLQNLGDLSLKFHGGVLEWVVNIVLSLAVSLIRPVLQWVIEDFTQGIVGSLIETYNGLISGLLENGALYT
ncbi:hypothetical protein RI129_005595 [Pyrocoelia pectoralis]|uniref:Uncharacterized protein n=1 Tax=Pyrocoelia pectoralis TaxID=417401 RepID=A0AAN7VL44_9COLE